MKTKVVNIFWSVILIGAGLIFLLRELGYVDFDFVSNLTWTLLFAAVAAFFWSTYVMRETREWGWLFPAAIFSGIALVTGLEGTALGRALSGAPILAGVALPFFVAYAGDPRTRQWALIPAWVLTVLSVIVLVERYVSGNLIGAVVLYSIALPFLVVYLQDRSHRWALIPFAVLSVVGTIPLLEMFISGDLFSVLVVLLLATPFYVVFFWSRENWWALIPAGVFTSIALPLAAEAITGISFPAEILLGGMGLTFGLLWLLRSDQPTDWAKFPAFGLFTAAAAVFFAENRADIIGPLMLVAAGVIILLGRLFRKPEAKKPEEKVEPEK